MYSVWVRANVSIYKQYIPLIILSKQNKTKNIYIYIHIAWCTQITHSEN